MKNHVSMVDCQSSCLTTGWVAFMDQNDHFAGSLTVEAEARAKSRTPNVDGHGSVLCCWKSFEITLHWHRKAMPFNFADILLNMFDELRK